MSQIVAREMATRVLKLTPEADISAAVRAETLVIVKSTIPVGSFNDLSSAHDSRASTIGAEPFSAQTALDVV